MKKVFLNILFFLFSVLCFSNTTGIELIKFSDLKTYNPGSGVSVHINPTAEFVLDDPSNLQASTNNAFHLELSEPGGDFTNPVSLGTVYDFYTPLMNGEIPTGTTAGQYKLRVRATNPATVVETNLFTIDDSVTSALPTVQTTVQSNTNYFECLNDGANTTNPYFGSLKQSYDAVTADMPSSYKFLQVTASNSSYTLNVNLIDITAGTTTALTATSAGVYTIPDTLSVGTYNLEIEEVDSSGNSSFFSTTFIFHASATIFGNASSEIVCVGEEVVFSIDITNLGIGSNYMASYYTFDFGDGTAPIIKTQAELLEDYTSPVTPITHTFSQASCSTLSTNFDIEMKLYNKGLSVGGTTPACDEYIANGSGATKQVTTSESPDANFVLNEEQCITENITAINTSTPGSYPTPAGQCTEEPAYSWYYKPPTSTTFIPVFAGSPWLVGNNLIIPAADITVSGCWEIKLTAVNQDYCQQETEYTDTVNIEDVPVADFNIIKDGQEVSQICANDTVTLTDNSNIIEATCDVTLPNEDPTYQWTISPNSGYTLQNSTTLNSQNPELTFTTEATYTITLVVTTECGTDSHTETLEVIGNPTAAFPVESQTYCSTSTLLIDFANLLTPTYSTGLNAPTSYTWTVSGTGITAADYSFANSTTASDALPTIQLNSFGTYSITVTLGSNCGTPASDTVTISLGQTPIITNTITSQTICSGASSTEFTTTADVAGTTFSWIATDNSNLSGYTSSGTTAAIPAQTITNNNNSDQDLVYAITPISDGCAGTPFEYTITVNPVPIIADKDETICDGEAFTITPVDDSPTEIVPAGTTYDWGIPVSSPVGAITGGAAAANQTSISQTLTNTTSAPATLTYTVTSDANGCKGDGFDVVITVNPTVGVDAIPDQTLCNGDNTLAVEFSTTIDNNSQGSGQIASDDFTYSDGSLVGNGAWVNHSGTAGTLLVSSGQAILQEDGSASEDANIPFTPVSGVLYYGLDFSVSAAADVDGNDYEYFAHFKAGTSTYGALLDVVPGTGGGNYTLGLSSASSSADVAWGTDLTYGVTYRAIVKYDQDSGVATLWVDASSSSDTSITGSTPSSGTSIDSFALRQSNSATDETVTVDNLIIGQTFDEVSGASTSPQVTGTITYNWTNDNIAIGLAASGTGDIPSFTATNNTTAQISGNITVTAVYTYNDVSCTGTAETFSITVNPSPLVNFSEADQVITSGETTTAVDLTSPTTDVTFAWTVSVPTGITGVTTLTGTDNIPAETLINSTTAPLDVVYTAIATGDIGFDCEGLPTLYTVTVNPQAQVNPVDDQIVCNDENLTIEFSTIVTGGTTTYSWTNDNTAIGLDVTGTGNIDITAINTTDEPLTANIVVTPSFENNGDTNTGDPITFTITVNPTGQVNVVGNQIVSNGFDTTAIAFSTTNINGTTTYAWTNSITSIGLAATGTGNISAFTGINTGTSPVTSSLTVIPTFENGNVSCIGPATTFEITINPTAQVNPTDDMVVSDGDTVTIPFTTVNTGGTTTYTWTNTDPKTG